MLPVRAGAGTMSDTVRFGVSLGLDLLDQFDTLINKMGYDNRSEAVRDLIRQKLTEEQWRQVRQALTVLSRAPRARPRR